MNISFAQKLITEPGRETTKQLFAGAENVFWVDWREADDDIITLAANALATTDLRPQWTDDVLYINFQGNLTKIPLNFEPEEQDITLVTLNSAISAEFNIRFITASNGGDTIAFLVLDNPSWAQLESEFGEKVDSAFQKIELGAQFLK
ncbi:hypothetical protein [Undibacterium sp. Ji49W]|uniref:hypothetical protein n=1 Tax=Undibacterium sp. Ji49W TaxID=3413040 RepID=UPI003BF124ED